MHLIITMVSLISACMKNVIYGHHAALHFYSSRASQKMVIDSISHHKKFLYPIRIVRSRQWLIFSGIIWNCICNFTLLLFFSFWFFLFFCLWLFCFWCLLFWFVCVCLGFNLGFCWVVFVREYVILCHSNLFNPPPPSKSFLKHVLRIYAVSD